MEKITITTKGPGSLNQKLEALAERTDRNKSYIMRRALEEFLQDEDDYEDALSILSSHEKTYSMEQVMRENDLQN